MAVANTIREKITKWLGIGSTTNTIAHVPAAGYNPDVQFEYSDTAPYTLTITETSYSWMEKKNITLKTVIEYDKPATNPSRKVIRVYPQEYIE